MANQKPKQINRILLFVGTVVSLYFVPWPILGAWIRPIPGTVQEQVDKAEDYGFHGIVVCIQQKGTPTACYASGYKNREKKIPADPQALFKIASVGKLYDALAVAKLVRAQKLSLDKTLTDYLPELSGRIAHADQITLRMLVQHRSGIPNFTDTYMYWANPKETAEEQLALVLDQPADFLPGTDYAYCNTNYLLLGKIMDRVLGYDKFQYIEEAILKPLHLERTFGSIEDVDLQEVMSGYYVGYEADLKTSNVGSMLATAEDLCVFVRALNDGSAFSDDQEREIYASLYEFGHTGLIPGYQTIAKYHEDVDAVVVQFTNTVDFEGYNWSLSEIIYNRILGILRRSS